MFYQNHLKRMGLTVTGMILFNILITSFLLISRGTFLRTVSRPEVFIRPFIGLITGITIYVSSKNEWLRKRGFIIVTVMTVVYAVMTLFGKELENTLDFSLLILMLSSFTFFESDRAERAWKKLLRKKTQFLDIRIAGRAELFDPVVILPHLEVNEKVTIAIDHLLRTSATTAPLMLNIHCAERISESLRNTFVECLRMHYRDEKRQIIHFLEGRYDRMLGLLVVSIAAMIIWTTFSPANDAGEKVVWQVLGNFAAFSLWQIGSTHFERTEAYLELMRFMTAENLSVTFIERKK